MADPPASSDTGVRHDHPSPTGTPRWVKAFAVIAVVLVVLVAVMLLSGGRHGPSRHTSADAAGHTPAPGAMKAGVVGTHGPPAGAHAP